MHSTTRLRTLAALAVLAAAPRVVPLSAQDRPAESPARAVRTLVAGAATADLRVDGRLDEAAWATAPAAGDFVQQAPNAGQPATQRTEARVLVDAEAVYVGVRMYDTNPSAILAQLTRRDESSASDGVRVFIDSYDDRRTAFAFGLNPRGVKEDFLRFGDGAGSDHGWDAIWDGAARVDSLGWTAEFRIPLSQLRFDATALAAGGNWGINFRRYLARADEVSFWAPIPPNVSAFVSLFGDLDGLAQVRQGRRLELLPYTSARLSRVPGTRTDPYWRANDAGGSLGADVKVGLPAGLTLSATLNPDFGQVEVDPASVNLSAFETFYDERRPFFVEGSDIFRFGQVSTFNSWGGPDFFYSRRIGRAPQGGVEADDAYWVDGPDASTILGAAKVSGKTGGWSLGALNAVTQHEEARWESEDGTVRGRQPVEPLTNYFAGRVRRDLNGGRTVLGGLLTSTNRDLRGADFDGFLRAGAYVAGVDGEHAFGADRAWTLSGFLAGSRVTGSEDAIALTQRSSARYYQRPDADHLDYDSTATALNGHAMSLGLQRSGSWDMSLLYQEVSPGFEVNDLGFQSRGDARVVSGFLGRRVNKPNHLFRSHAYFAYANRGWTFGGENFLTVFGVGGEVLLPNLWSGSVQAQMSPRVINDRLTRGGPLAYAPAQWNVDANFGTDSRRRVSLSGGIGYREDDGGEYDRAASLTLRMRPSSSVQVSLGPSASRQRDTDQFVRSVADPLATATFGRRYVLADVEQTTLAMNARVDWTFSPTLSLQVYAQPYLAVGDFENYKELRRPRSFDFRPYGAEGSTLVPEAGGGFRADPDGAGPAPGFVVGAEPGQRDFTFQSLRGNAVLRWEYRPGSALFLVWQQERAAEAVDGRLDLGDDLRGIFERRGSNVFLVKLTYWLNG